jgi:putative salt-induced outer membrane protein YdiY
LKVRLILLFLYAPGILVLANSYPVHADEVVLRNGDRLTGLVVHKARDTLTLRSAYAGNLAIPWSSVTAISTEAPVELILTDDRRTSTRLGAGKPGGSAEPGESVRLDEIVFINPTPDESGTSTVTSGHATLSAATTSGNSSGTRTYADADYSVRGKRYRWSFSGKANRVTDSGQETASNWLTSGDFDRFVAADRFLYARASAEHDPFKDIDLRTAVGGGYGYQFVENQKTKVSLRGGLDYVVVDRATSPNERYPALGWGFKSSHQFDGSGSEAFHEHDGYWNFRNGGDITIRSRTGLRVPLLDGLTATAQVNVEWDRTPAEGRKSTDTTSVLGLGYTF